MYVSYIQNMPNNVSDIKNHPAEITLNKLKQPISKLFFTPNGLGKMLCRWLAPYSGVITRKCENDLFINATRTLLAIKAYRKDHNKFPETLENLTPDYLEEVLTDTYDGKPIRYSPEKRLIYSIGEDLKDSGGSEKNLGDNTYTNKWRTEDIVFKIEP